MDILCFFSLELTGWNQISSGVFSFLFLFLPTTSTWREGEAGGGEGGGGRGVKRVTAPAASGAGVKCNRRKT